MKLLFDQNLSYKLVTRLAGLYPASQHARNIGLVSAHDQAIWEYAKINQFVLVTKDEDFHARSILFGQPPKVLWIRSGNCSTDLVETLLVKNHDEIQRFEADRDVGFMALY